MASKKTKPGSGKSQVPAKKPINWKKTIVPLFLALTMLLSIFAIAGSSLFKNSGSSTRDITLDKSFNNIQDGLRLLPSAPVYARYVDFEADRNITDWMGENLGASIPARSEFGVWPKKDMLANYSAGYFGDYKQQWVSVTDFGNSALINYNTTDYGGQPIAEINEQYYFTPAMDPVVSGRYENVVKVLDTVNAGGDNSYADYSDLFEKLKGYDTTARDAKLSVVGRECAVNFTDKYYAGLTPKNGYYDYKVVAHLNRPFNETEKQEMKSAWEQTAMYVYGFDALNVKFDGDYLVLDGRGNFETCIRDMTYVWAFLRS